MLAFSVITRSNFFIKLKSWEYWPFGILQFPLFFYFIWLSLKARSLLFFSASNPGIPMGGMFGESKFEILKKIPHKQVPRTTFIKSGTNAAYVEQTIRDNGFLFPVIFKPDIGERGFMVKRISSTSDISKYLSNFNHDFLIQEFVDLPLEFGVFYIRYPKTQSGKVVSIVGKEMLAVVGDGSSTIRRLILKNDRAKLQWKRLKETYADRLDEVLSEGTKLELVSIGNHALGTKFLDRTDLINAQVSEAFDRISKQIDGFYFGRFDMRCSSTDDLSTGNVMILELNGCGAEPAHIYQPGFSIFKALTILLEHWRNIYEVSLQNRENGIQFISLKEGYRYYRKFKSAIK